MNPSSFVLAVVVPLALGLGACSKSENTPGENTKVAATANSLTGALDSAGGMSTVSGGLTSTGLATIFDGKGSYTVIAPTDAAFAKLGDTGAALTQPEQRSALAAILRDHIVPGELTAADIGKAIDAADDHAVKMRTMGSGDLTFRKASGGIQVTASDGATAMLAGTELKAKGSVAIPADGVLKKI